MSEERIRWKHYPPYFLLKGFCALVRLLPMALVWRITTAVSRVAYLLDGKHRRVALRNLDIAFGAGKSPAEKRKIVRGAFKSIFLTEVEFFLIPSIVPDVRSFMRITNFRAVESVLQRKRGLIFIVCHSGNWEIMAHLTIEKGCKLASIGRPLKNPLIYREIERLRCYNGGAALKKKWVTREIIARLKQNWCIAILIDQYAGRNAPFVPFFGRPVSTTPAAVLLAMKTGAGMVPVFDVREGYGRHHMHCCDPVETVNTGNRDADIRENCARLNRVIEEWVRRYPEQWLWMHRRWRKKKAPGEP